MSANRFSGNTVGFTARGDTARITNGTIVTDDTSGGVAIVGSGDTVDAVPGVTQSGPVLDDPTVSDIDAVYDTVLDRDPTPSELITAQTELATGVGLNGLMSTLANSAEMQADLTSTFEAASGAYQSLMTAQPQSNEEQTVTSIDPTQPEFNAFADVMFTSYGAPIEIVSFDPYSGVQTELADTNAAALTAWGNQVDTSGGQITLIGHSYGADTAASVVANGLKVQTLVTLDPVSYFRPDLHQVAANSGQWLNYVAAGGGLTLPNAIAGIGSAWNDVTVGYATSTTNVSTDHGGIEGAKIFKQLLGVSV